MTVSLLVLSVVLVAVIGVYKWQAHNAEVRRNQAFQQQRNVATQRLERVINRSDSRQLESSGESEAIRNRH